jgi:predicted ATPase/class 3 adenylate cyclase
MIRAAVRPELPTGTVTFLFTDVEGSTRLLHSLGADAYAEALAQHRRVIREACAAEDGVEVDTQGDAFLFAFPTAPGALVAAAAFTDALASGPIRVRVGLHTGTPLLTDEGYVGDDLHRAARIAAAGHGGQILVSSSTASLIAPSNSSLQALSDLGEHRFKDLAAAERVFQLGDAEFPPLASLYRSNLPVPAHPLVGRKKELLEAMRLLRGEARIVTVTGPGGVGKTRFAVAVAAEVSDGFPDGVWFVPLASLRDAELVPTAVAGVVGAEGELAAHFGAGRALLVLDNVEHVIAAASGLAELVSRCPGLRVLATSRESLRVAPEYEYPLSPLPESPAVELFRQRAAAVAPAEEVEYEAALAICERVDRLPLAIELAAARCKALSPPQILERLAQRLDLLEGGRDADARQRTLRSTIEWSYELLGREEQELFARLAVFVGGCTLAAAEEVCDADLDTLQSLVEKSLVRFSGERYWMLETIRELAEEKLVAGGSADELRLRHAEHFLRLGRSLGLTMENLERVGAQRHDVAIAEQHNFRAAIDWAFEADLALAVELAFALENFWVTHDPQEGIRRFDAFLARPDELPVRLRAVAHRCRGNVTIMAGDRSGGVEHYGAALAAYRESGDEIGALLMEHRLFVNSEVGDLRARKGALEALLARARAVGLATLEVQILGSLAGVVRRQRDVDAAVELLRTALAKAESIGFAWTERGIRESLARAYLDDGHIDEAREQGTRALELARRTGDRLGAAWSLTFFTILAARAGEPRRAGVLWGALEAEAERKPLGIWAEDRGEAEAALPLDDPEFERGRERGRGLPFEEAMEYALGSA